MMVDPFATSKVWHDRGEQGPVVVVGAADLTSRTWESGKARAGVPIGNFVGWWLAPFFIVFIFYLFFQQKGQDLGQSSSTSRRLLAYFWIFWTVAIVVLEMNWFENGMNRGSAHRVLHHDARYSGGSRQAGQGVHVTKHRLNVKRAGFRAALYLVLVAGQLILTELLTGVSG